MKKRFLNIILFTLMISLLQACNPVPPPVTTPSREPATQIPPTATLELPTTTPTEPPVVNPIDYLLQIGDLPKGLECGFGNLVEEITADFHLYSIFVPCSNYLLKNSITIYEQRPTEIPETGREGEEPIESPKIGLLTRAYTNSFSQYDMTLEFVKDRALVQISIAGFDFDTLVRLAKLLEARLPEVTPDTLPISFPEESDNSLFDEYFSNIELKKTVNFVDIELAAENVISAQSFEHPCLTFEGDEVYKVMEKPSIAIYSFTQQLIIYKKIFPWNFGEGPICFDVNLPPGQYEFRISIDDKIIHTIPFLVQ